MNLLEQQASNRRKTWLIMLAFVAFLFLLGLGFDTLYLGEAGGVVPVGSLRNQKLLLAIRHGDAIESEDLGPVRFVPLIGAAGFHMPDDSRRN